jgi:hypothetical protein
MSNPISYTKLVRKVMKKHGKSRIYTNRLNDARTVKCYAFDTDTDTNNMITEIDNELAKLNINFVIRKRKNDIFHNTCTLDSIIVEVPYQ